MWGIAEKVVTLLYERFQGKRAVDSELQGLKQGLLLMTTIANRLDTPLAAATQRFVRRISTRSAAAERHYGCQEIADLRLQHPAGTVRVHC